MKTSTNISKLTASLALVCFLSACSQISQRQINAVGTGVVFGALLGAGAGGGIAAANTHGALNKAGGAGIGVLAGALVGAAIGAAIGYIVAGEPNQQPPRP